MEEFATLGKSLDGVVTIVDATYASPYLLKPIQYGVDVVLHSGSVPTSDDISLSFMEVLSVKLFVFLCLRLSDLRLSDLRVSDLRLSSLRISFQLIEIHSC